VCAFIFYVFFHALPRFNFVFYEPSGVAKGWGRGTRHGAQAWGRINTLFQPIKNAFLAEI